ncbi:hypothetical protein HMI54_013021 [Coelomomyces lativittatus]|nr:hypothetical protein HMI54_013021 [Coelomomyces lativittatus]
MVEEKNLRSCIRVSSIDNYQGEETDVVLISLVRSTFEDGSEKGIGFLNIENRMNVLLSRARHGMYILGNASLLEGKSKVWNKVIQLLRKQELMGDALPIVCQNHPETIRFISSPGSFAIEAPDGGCLLPCSSRLQKCGHICERHCHSDDKEHLTVKCRKPCLRLHDQCQHPCPKLCFKDCGKCETRVPDIILPGCNHIYPNPKCTEAQSVSKLVCKRILEKNRFCGHSFMIPCHKDINLEPCKRKCNDILKCGHNCNRECSQCLRSNKEEKLHGPCLQPCGQSLACLHTCQVPCDKHESNSCPPCKEECIHTNCDHGKCRNICSEPCLPCMEKCTWTCEHEPNCPLPCGAPCVRLPCNIRCKKLLSCGHVCPSLCGEPCPSSKYCKECCDDKIKSFPVDMLLFQEYREVNVDETPILVLPCGHFYTYETLDGVFEINKYYHQLGNQFVDVKELPSNDEIRIMACPDCRTPIQAYHVKRYSRILKKAVLLLNDKHYTVMLSKELVNLDASIKSYPQELEKLNENVRARNRLSGDKKRPEDILFRSLQTELVSFISKLKKNPSRKVYNAMLTCFDDFSSVRKRKTNTYNQREIDKLNGALKNTPIVRNYFVEEGKANLLLYQLYSHDFTSQLNEKYTTSSSSLAYASLNVAKVLFEKSNHVFDGAIKHLNLGKAHFRVLEAHIFLFEFTLKYLEYLYKVRMSKSFYFFSSNEQKSLSEIMDEKIEWILPKFDTMKHLSQEINKHDYDESFINYMSQFRKLQEGMRQGSTVPPLSELGYIVSALSGTVGTTGHWYSCPNGHLYVIGDCGQAMEGSNCPECGALVGGADHQLNSTNRREDTLINSALQAFRAG